MVNKSNKQHYWFKRRRYGYGWTPVTWQGWTVMVLFLAVVIVNAIIITINPYSNELLWLYLNVLIVAVVSLLIIAYTKGPTPRWRWGKKRNDNGEEDL